MSRGRLIGPRDARGDGQLGQATSPRTATHSLGVERRVRLIYFLPCNAIHSAAIAGMWCPSHRLPVRLSVRLSRS